MDDHHFSYITKLRKNKPLHPRQQKRRPVQGNPCSAIQKLLVGNESRRRPVQENPCSAIQKLLVGNKSRRPVQGNPCSPS
jgi:hypothetical protein